MKSLRTFTKKDKKYLVTYSASSFSSSTGSPCRVFMGTLLGMLDPQRQRSANVRIAKDTLHLIHDVVVPYFSPFLLPISSTGLLWNLLHSSPMPPVVSKGGLLDFHNSASIHTLLFILM